MLTLQSSGVRYLRGFLGPALFPDQAQGHSFWAHWRLPLAIALFGLVINIIVAANMAPTTDEWCHVDYGVKVLQGATDRSNFFEDSKMPVSVLNALPRAASKYLRTHGRNGVVADALRDLRAWRSATIAAAVVLSLLCFAFAFQLYGRVPGLMSQFLCVISPNLIAHGTLATTDLYVTLAAMLFLYALRVFLLAPSSRNAFLVGVVLGAAQLTKFTATYLYVVLVLVLVAALIYSRFARSPSWVLSGGQCLMVLAWSTVMSILLINAGFLFQGTLRPLSAYSFRSVDFRSLQNTPVLRDLPLPLPSAYLQGFDWLRYHDSTGVQIGNIVLLGEVRGYTTGGLRGFPSYYAVAYLLKEPIGMQILLVLGLIWTLRNRKLGEILIGEGLLIITAAVYFIAMSFFSNTHIGIRHILPALAAFVILSGGAFVAFTKPGWKWKAVPLACLLWICGSVASYFPHMIPYFNELLPDRRLAYRWLADSNLDWGQSAWLAQRFLAENPDVVLNPPVPTKGRVLVSANLVAGVGDVNYWLRKTGLTPTAHVGYGHLLFEVP